MQLGPGRAVPGPGVAQVVAVIAAEQDDLVAGGVVDHVGVVPGRWRGGRVQLGPGGAVPGPSVIQITAAGERVAAAAEQQQLPGSRVVHHGRAGARRRCRSRAAAWSRWCRSRSTCCPARLLAGCQSCRPGRRRTAPPDRSRDHRPTTSTPGRPVPVPPGQGASGAVVPGLAVRGPPPGCPPRRAAALRQRRPPRQDRQPGPSGIAVYRWSSDVSRRPRARPAPAMGPVPGGERPITLSAVLRTPLPRRPVRVPGLPANVAG